jgi:hypothetical protein
MATLSLRSIVSLLSLVTYFISCNAYAEGESAKTRSGNELGGSISSYVYEEPSLGMSTKGDKFGINHVGTAELEGDWFIKDDIRFVIGSVDYVGSGYQTGAPDWYAEVRGMLGRDIQLSNSVISPYVGFGYRYLFNDLRGYSSDGSIGYRRESNYFYIPLGVTHRFNLDSDGVIATTLEFDKLISGKQISRLSDLVGHAGYSDVQDVTNVQASGSGFRAAVMYETDDWAFGPFLNLWWIGESDTVLRLVTQYGTPQWYFFSEPQNRTTEFGMRMQFKF